MPSPFLAVLGGIVSRRRGLPLAAAAALLVQPALAQDRVVPPSAQSLRMSYAPIVQRTAPAVVTVSPTLILSVAATFSSLSGWERSPVTSPVAFGWFVDSSPRSSASRKQRPPAASTTVVASIETGGPSFGSTVAHDWLQAEGSTGYAHYEEQLAALRAALAARPEAAWTGPPAASREKSRVSSGTFAPWEPASWGRVVSVMSGDVVCCAAKANGALQRRAGRRGVTRLTRDVVTIS